MYNVNPDLVLAPRAEHMPSQEIGYSLLKRFMTTNPKRLSTHRFRTPGLNVFA